MDFIKTTFTAIVFQPLYNALVALYVIIPDLGVAIVLLTIAIRFLLLPTSKKSIESQKKMQEVQPEIKKIQAKYKNDKQLQGQKVMAFYKKKKINPASGCLPLIIQLIFLIALYRVFLLALDPNGTTDLLYSFAKDPETLNPISLGILDLSKPHIPLAIIAAALQFVQGKMMIFNNKKKQGEEKKSKSDEKKDEPDFSTMLQQQMIYMGPIITLIIGVRFPSGLILYWAITTIFMIIQQYMILKKDKNHNPNNLTEK
ncbi:MAG: YidC/Oxa1 family membrane protein insertase [Patescibacteria group bacterium]|nr:YidC/Oxa1 family membrane protein insertase [Patescibacteria group bacterium]